MGFLKRPLLNQGATPVWNGLASTLDVGGTLAPENVFSQGSRACSAALSKDWVTIGADLNRSFHRYALSRKIKIRTTKKSVVPVELALSPWKPVALPTRIEAYVSRGGKVGEASRPVALQAELPIEIRPLRAFADGSGKVYVRVIEPKKSRIGRGEFE